MGPTGAGKSTFVDRAVGTPDTSAGHDLTSCTKEVRAVRYPHADGVRNIVLVDTPGFDDTFVTDAQILKKIARWLKSTYEKNIKLSGLLYLHRISDNRIGGTPLRNYNMFKELCGKDNFKNVILVTTMWDEVTEEVGSAREQELCSNFWRAMIALGSTTHRFENTTESAWKIINSLSVPPLASRRPLRIQWEMVDEQLPLHMTAAGRTVLDSLNGIMSGFKGVLKRFRTGKKGLPNPTLQHNRSPVRKSSSLRSTSSVFTSSDSSAGCRSVGTGVISVNSSGTCSMEGYQNVVGQVTSALRASLSAAELLRIRSLKNAIAPSLSVALFLEVNFRR
ncbi:P-loop containing nucleoside triphosphate hydrolase protein [Pisolithus marmoratus]|nr:P-loop containing nucleoside triphosphate hydrolase protein [Pisolithus marmoratus]